MRIQLLLTGSELMAGDTIDSNSAAIAQAFTPLGAAIYRKVTVGDDMALLVKEIDQLSRDGDVLIVNGGLGPTIDDLTAEALGAAMEQPLLEHPEAIAHVEQWCAKRHYPSNDANRKQAILPRGVDIIPNATGSAVGFHIRHNECEIFCTPGVPSELGHMLDQEIVPRLQRQFGANLEPVAVRRLRLFGIGESSLQQMVNEHCTDWPAQVELGFRAGLPLLEVKLTTRASGLESLRDQWEARLRDLVGDYIVGEDDCTLAQSLVQALQTEGLRLCTAESCTGGLIAAQICEVPGASSVFEAGYVTYSNTIKERAVGVKSATLEAHGAVSEAVVREMAAGAAERSDADLAVAVSGIAGPDGGSPDKPVGTVWIAWGYRDKLQARQFYIPNNRHYFQQLTAAIALDLCRRTALGMQGEPRYFRERGK